MSMGVKNNDSDDEEEECCPICIEPLDDYGETKVFMPCPCNYRVCMFCVRRITTEFTGRCPGCRREYKEEMFRFVDKPPASSKPRSRKKKQQQEVLTANGHQRTATQQQQLKQQELQQRVRAQQQQLIMQQRQQQQAQKGGQKHGKQGQQLAGATPVLDAKLRKELSNMRVVQKDLVYLVGLAPSIANEATLRSTDFFGQYGEIIKVALNRPGDRDDPSYSGHITFARDHEAMSAIKAVNGFCVDGHVIKASLGTTKYCSAFLRGSTCNNPDCTFLHQLGDVSSSFTKEQMAAGAGTFLTATQVPDSAAAAAAAAVATSTSPSLAAAAAVAPAAVAASSPAAGWGGQPPGGAGGWAAAAAGGSSGGPGSSSLAPTPSQTLEPLRFSKAGNLGRASTGPPASTASTAAEGAAAVVDAAGVAAVKTKKGKATKPPPGLQPPATPPPGMDVAAGSAGAEAVPAPASPPGQTPAQTKKSKKQEKLARQKQLQKEQQEKAKQQKQDKAAKQQQQQQQQNKKAPVSSAETPTESVLDLLAALAGASVEEYDSAHPARRKPALAAPGAEREHLARAKVLQTAYTSPGIQAEVEKARAEVAVRYMTAFRT